MLILLEHDKTHYRKKHIKKKKTLMGILNLVGFFEFSDDLFSRSSMCSCHLSRTSSSPKHGTASCHIPEIGGVHIIMWVPHSWTLYNEKYWNSIFSFGWFGLIWRVSGIHILDHFSLIWRGFPPAMRLLWPRRFHGCHSGLPVRWVWMNGDTVGPLLNRNIKSP